MGPIEIAVIVIVCVVAAAIIAAIIIRKIKGKPSFSSDCCGCPYAKDCHKNCASAKSANDANDKANQ